MDNKVTTCSKCKKEKLTTEFSKDKKSKHGLQSYCKSCAKARKKAYYESNKDKIKEYNKTYRESNKNKINAYQRKRNKEDLLFRLKMQVRNRVFNALKGSKSESTSKILGCSYEQLYLHLNYENLENPSHDHIIPLSWGNTEEEVLALARWENLQGMEMQDNFSKGNRYCAIAKANQVLKLHPNPEIISKILARAEKKGKNYVQKFCI